MNRPILPVGYNPKWEDIGDEVLVPPLQKDGIQMAIDALELDYNEVRASACASIEMGENSDALLAEAKGIKRSIKTLKELLK